MYIVFLSTSNLCSYLLFIIDKYLSALKMNALIVHHKCDCLQIVLIKKECLGSEMAYLMVVMVLTVRIYYTANWQTKQIKPNHVCVCMCICTYTMYVHWVRSVLFMLALSMRIIQNDALNKFERILGNFLRIWELNNFKRIMCLSLLGCVGDL